MNITKIQKDTTLTIAIEGRLDTMSAPALEQELSGGLDGITQLIFECSKLEYISSAGLRLFLKAYKIMQKCGDMKIVGVIDSVKEIFEVTGFAEFMTIED